MKHRNTSYVVRESLANYQQAIRSDLMQVTIKGRNGKTVTMPGGQEVVEFINCSYLGIDQHPKVLEAYRSVDPSWGVNFCCARSRFSIEPQRMLEEELSKLFRGRAITFPSVSTTHMSVMPLIASGVLINDQNPPKVHFIFDRFSHSSMNFLKPILAEEATIETVAHNDLEALRAAVVASKTRGETPVYVGDGVYSMGGLCPIGKVLEMADELDFYVYLDDAHGTSIFGNEGEGAVMSQIKGQIPDRLFITFCLSKGFGANGGGILLSNCARERLVRSFGQIYAFSAALDFSVVNSCLAAIELHRDGTVAKLQKQLRERVTLFDELMGIKSPFSPIRMVMIGDEQEALMKGRQLINMGYFASVVFFPIVPRGKAQLRLCLSASHTEEQIRGMVNAINSVSRPDVSKLPARHVAIKTPDAISALA